MAASVGDAAAAAGAEAQAAEVEVTVLTLAGEPLVVAYIPPGNYFLFIFYINPKRISKIYIFLLRF